MEIKKEYEPFMKDIFRALPETFFIKDIEGKYVFTTKVCDLVNAGPDETIVGKWDYEIQRDKELGMRYYNEDMEILEKGISTHTIDPIFDNGEAVYIEVLKNPIYNDEGEIIGICGICNNITELVNLREKYEQLSLFDSLTGLYNRNYTVKMDFDNESSLPCSYIVCDCNGLKKVNDKYGHDAGDQYICGAAKMLKGIVPKKSVIVRWGGDEFVIITPSCTKKLHEQIMQMIHLEQMKFLEQMPDIGLSIGGALRTDLNMSEQMALDLADERMYAEKALHKNKKEKD